MEKQDISLICQFLSNRKLNAKTNNYLFEDLTTEDIQMIKKHLEENPTSSVLNRTFDDHGIKEHTENLIYDCETGNIDDLKNLKMYWFLPTIPQGHTTFHVLNLQALDDIEKLNVLYQAVKRINTEKGCFHLYTTETNLKVCDVGLEFRDDLQRFRDSGMSEIIIEDDVERYRKNIN